MTQRTKQEPVAWMDADGNVSDNDDHKCFPMPLYTALPERTWVGLTDADWKEIEDMPDTFDQGVAWAQAKLKEKNT